MKVLSIALNPHLGIAVATAKAFAKRKAQTLFEEALAVHGLSDEVGQRSSQCFGAVRQRRLPRGVVPRFVVHPVSHLRDGERLAVENGVQDLQERFPLDRFHVGLVV